jgi:hypothetical protein
VQLHCRNGGIVLHPHLFDVSRELRVGMDERSTTLGHSRHLALQVSAHFPRHGGKITDIVLGSFVMADRALQGWW